MEEKAIPLTLEERCLIETVLKNHRKTTLNNRKQSTLPDKDHIYVRTATVIDQVLDKLK